MPSPALLGASGAWLVTAVINWFERIKGRHALCTMGIGVRQGIAVAIERVYLMGSPNSCIGAKKE
jgi:acetyl-CoA acetyltransferase